MLFGGAVCFAGQSLSTRPAECLDLPVIKWSFALWRRELFIARFRRLGASSRMERLNNENQFCRACL